MKARVDQRTIAELVGTSTSTVTKVLNHDPVYRVSDETRELILKTAKDLGYKPLRRRTRNIAFIVCGNLDVIDQELYRHVCAEASTLQYRVCMINIPDMPSFRSVSLSVNPLTVDGTIITGNLSPEMALQLSDILPVVTMGQYPERSGVDWVRADNKMIGKQLTNQLLSFGHKDIAVIVNRLDEVFSQQTLEGCKQAFFDAGLEFDMSMVWGKEHCGYPDVLKTIVEHDPRPTGLLCVTFGDHPIILSTLKAMGYDVPKDLSYVGWTTNDPSSMATFPVIACLDNMFLSLARVAVRRLMDRIENCELPGEDIIVPLEVRRGCSCTDISR